MLVGADKMLRLINNALEFGSNSILDQSYSVKSRIKTAGSLVEKVLTKRAEGDVDYTLECVTDIVGFRFLVLFKQDLTSLVSSFVDFLNKFHSEPTSILAGESLVEGVKEIIVYKTNVSEESYLAIFSQLKSFFKHHGFPDGFVKLDSKDTKYSSVHIVVNGLVYVGGQAKTIPVEFQLRTVFEDIWGEVEHRLIYKNRRLQDMEDSSIRQRMGQILLGNLKDQLDVGSEAADRAYFELLFEHSVETAKGSASSRALLVLDKIQDILPENAASAISTLREEIVSTYSVLSNLSDEQSVEAAASGFRQMCTSIEDFDKAWSDSCVQNEESVSKFRYMVDMEIAAGYYWQGQLASQQIGGASYRFEDSTSKEARKYFEKARRIYFDIASMSAYANDPILNLRLGEIFRNTHQLRAAQVYFETAHTAMDRSDWVGKGSIFESIIPRQLGYLYWLQSMELSQAYSDFSEQESGPVNHASQAVTDQILTKLANAFSATYGLDQLTITTADKERGNPEREKAVAYNNAMSYALEFIERGGSRQRLNEISENGFDLDFYKRFYTYYAPDGPMEIDIRMVETGLNSALLFDDIDHGLAWLKRAHAWLQKRPDDVLQDVLLRRVKRAVAKAENAWNTD